MSRMVLTYNKFYITTENGILAFSVLGIYIYAAIFAFPFNLKFDMPLLILAMAGISAAFASFRNRTYISLTHTAPIIFFLISFVISCIFSEDIRKSMLLSMHLLPGVLLYFLINKTFDSTRNTTNLYLATSIAIIGLGAGLFHAFITKNASGPFAWVVNMGSPIMVVKNDTTFLALMCPLSLALLYLRPFSIGGIIAALSLFVAVADISVFQSRIAVLTTVISISCFFIGIQKSRASIICGLVLTAIILTVDCFTGFPLMERFIRHWDGTGRIPLWMTAWQMFLESPLVGHGPHTFGLHYNSYISNHIFPTWLFVESRFVPWPHNLYLEVLAEQGLFGFVALVILLYKGLLVSWDLRKAIDRETRILGAGLFAALIGFCFASLFELTFLRQWVVITIFLLLGLTVRLSSIVKNKRENI